MQDVLYLNNQDVVNTGIAEGKNLARVWDTLESSLIAIGEGHVVMPGDTQLRPETEGCFDRINAKPAYMPDVAGIKWIASCCRNVEKGLPRASGVTILNDIETGRHFSILDTALLNLLRTAGVSMAFLRKARPDVKQCVLIGAGPIGEEHLRQLLEGKRHGFFKHIEEISVYDLNNSLAQSLCEKYASSDVRVTALGSLAACFAEDNVCHFLCTSTMQPFINKELLSQRKGLTVIHVGLRDYGPDSFSAFDHCFVDVWKSVCKLNTTLHVAHQQGLLNQDDCIELTDYFRNVPVAIKPDDNITLNPMGLPVYDLSVGLLIYNIAKKKSLGTWLD